MKTFLAALFNEDTLNKINNSDVSNPESITTTVQGGIIRPIVDFVLPIIFFLIIAYGIYGGILYITSYGSDEKALTGKKTMLYSVIGAIIIASAWLVVRYVLSVTGVPEASVIK
jgi:hypothetical protein